MQGAGAVRNLLIASFLLVLQIDCVTTRPVQKPLQSEVQKQRGNSQCPERPTMLFEQGTFDGRWVRGRMLIEAGSKDVLIHSYALPTATFSILHASECNSTRKIIFSNPALTGGCQSSDVCAPMRLHPGHLFGRDVEFLAVFDEPRQCVDLTVVLSLPDPNEGYGPPEIRLRARQGEAVEVTGANSCQPPRAPSSDENLNADRE